MKSEEFFDAFSKLLEANDVEGTKSLLEQYPSIYQDRSEMFGVMQACCLEGRSEFVKSLLKLGFNVNIVDPNAYSPARPIIYAIHGKSRELVDLLIANGSDVNWGWSQHPVHCVPLFHAIPTGDLALVQSIVKAGAMINSPSTTRMTPLDLAIARNQSEIADYLRSRGALTAAEVRAKQGGS